MNVEVRFAAMAANYLPYEPEQMLLLPCALQEWLPEGHLAYYISDTVVDAGTERVSRSLRMGGGRATSRFTRR